MQRGAFNELHGDVKDAVLLAGVIDGDDVGMVQHPGGARFILETAHHFLRVQSVDVEPHGLERYHSANGRIHGLVHDAHGAAPQLTGNLVSANRLYRHHEGLNSFFDFSGALVVSWGRDKNSIGTSGRIHTPESGENNPFCYSRSMRVITMHVTLVSWRGREKNPKTNLR